MSNQTPLYDAKPELEHYNTIPDLMQRTHTSESYWRKLIQRGGIQVVGFGANVRIPESEFLKFVGGSK